MKSPAMHKSQAGHELYGSELESGDVLEADDWYLSTIDGNWVTCPNDVIGVVKSKLSGLTWVRRLAGPSETRSTS